MFQKIYALANENQVRVDLAVGLHTMNINQRVKKIDIFELENWYSGGHQDL